MLDEIPRNAYESIRRVVLLEFRFSIRAATTSCSRLARHLLHQRWAISADLSAINQAERGATLCLTDPASTDTFNREYLEKVKRVHEDGGEFGSIGYRYPWREAETSKLVLRTHTTAVSAAMLYEIANQPGGFRPCKLFSIDRVFRNETVDATHLAEFHQVEGVVADENITLGDLIGFMEVFFKKMGLTNLKFKASSPYACREEDPAN